MKLVVKSSKLLGILFVLASIAVASPASAGSVSVVWTNMVCAVGQKWTYVGTSVATPPGSYTVTYSISDLTNHQTWTSPTFVRPLPGAWGTGTVAIGSASDLVTLTLTINGHNFVGYPCAKPNKYNFMDGRCNQEPWQSFAIYPDGKGGWIFYALYQGVGTYAMHVTKAFMDANPDTGVNHIIVQADGIQLWRLQGGLLQAHRIGLNGKDYWFNLDHCDGATAPSFPPPVPNTY